MILLVSLIVGFLVGFFVWYLGTIWRFGAEISSVDSK